MTPRNLWPTLLIAFASLSAQAVFGAPNHVYKGHGVTFRYPAGMTANSQLNSGVSTIIIKGAATDPTTLTVQVCPPVMTPAAAGRLFVQGIKIGMGASAHLGAAVPAHMTIAGTVRQGNRYPLTVAGMPFVMELYPFQLGNAVLNVAEIRPNGTATERSAGQADFSTVAGSLRSQP